MLRRRNVAPLAALLAALTVSGCNGIDLGDNPSADVRKETGPLTLPPPGVVRGTAQ